MRAQRPFAAPTAIFTLPPLLLPVQGSSERVQVNGRAPRVYVCREREESAQRVSVSVSVSVSVYAVCTSTRLNVYTTRILPLPLCK